MKKFVGKLIILLSILLAITILVNYVYIRMNKEDPDCIEKFSSIPSNIQLCNFGSSHGLYGYNYEDFDDEYTCFNFALSSQSLAYDYRLLENYKDNISEGAVVFINVSYFSLFGLNEEETEGFEAKNKRYYSILPDNLIKEYDRETDIYVNYLPSLSTSTANLLKSLIGKSNNTNEATWRRVSSDIDVQKDANEAYGRHIESDKFDEDGKRIINDEAVNSLYDLIYCCKERGYVPIVITVPFLSEYTDTVMTNDTTFLQEFYDVLNEVIKNTNVEYYDYAFDDRFYKAYGLFMNSDHLNKDGAKEFVDILMEEIVFKNKYLD